MGGCPLKQILVTFPKKGKCTILQFVWRCGFVNDPAVPLSDYLDDVYRFLLGSPTDLPRAHRSATSYGMSSSTTKYSQHCSLLLYHWKDGYRAMSYTIHLFGIFGNKESYYRQHCAALALQADNIPLPMEQRIVRTPMEKRILPLCTTWRMWTVYVSKGPVYLGT